MDTLGPPAPRRQSVPCLVGRVRCTVGWRTVPASPPPAAAAARTLTRRRRRIALAGLLVGALTLVAPGCGDDATTDLNATPGYDGEGRTIDTRPFEAPTVEGDGSTTLPQSLFENGPLASSTTTTTAPPTTTTTFPLPASHPDAICNGFIDLVELTRDARDRPDTLEPAQVAALVADLARRLEQIGEPAYEPAVAQLDESAARLGASSSDDELREAVRDMLASERPWEPVVSHAQGTCPEILTAG